jgi:hypothetical protein
MLWDAALLISPLQRLFSSCSCVHAPTFHFFLLFFDSFFYDNDHTALMRIAIARADFTRARNPSGSIAPAHTPHAPQNPTPTTRRAAWLAPARSSQRCADVTIIWLYPKRTCAGGDASAPAHEVLRIETPEPPLPPRCAQRTKDSAHAVPLYLLRLTVTHIPDTRIGGPALSKLTRSGLTSRLIQGESRSASRRAPTPRRRRHRPRRLPARTSPSETSEALPLAPSPGGGRERVRWP